MDFLFSARTRDKRLLQRREVVGKVRKEEGGGKEKGQALDRGCIHDAVDTVETVEAVGMFYPLDRLS